MPDDEQRSNDRWLFYDTAEYQGPRYNREEPFGEVEDGLKDSTALLSQENLERPLREFLATCDLRYDTSALDYSGVLRRVQELIDGALHVLTLAENYAKKETKS